tara:strand:+ start:97 stop:324 length:228 start_codon:yes stop_codon:yes gene_type:complete
MTVRLTFPIPDETHEVLCIIPHGMRKFIYQSLIFGLADELKKDPATTLAHIIAKQTDVKQMILKGIEKDEPTPAE